MEINYIGLATATKVVLPKMLERRRGDLVQFGSLAGWASESSASAQDLGAEWPGVISFTEERWRTNCRGVACELCACARRSSSKRRRSNR